MIQHAECEYNFLKCGRTKYVLRLHLARSENHELKVNNSLIVWRPKSLLEGRSRETEKSEVANLCVANGVKGARMIFGGHGIHIATGTCQGKY